MREDEKQRSSKSEEKPLNIQRLFRKRWVLPALYLIAAAGILGSVFFMQGQDESAAPEDSVEVTDSEQGNDMSPYGENAIEVTTSSEVIEMPVEDEADVNIVGHYYDVDAPAEEQQEALVYYNNTYFPSKGVDFAHAEGESFNATAALSGTVLRAEKDALLGYVVELTHDNGVVTHYHSLESIEVEEGATVTQGDILGRAGRNIYNEDAGVHVHFEIRQDGVAVNPSDVFMQPIDSIKDAVGKDEEEKPADGQEEQEEQEVMPDEEQAPVEDAPAEDGEENEQS